MNTPFGTVRHHLARLIAVAVIGALYWATQLPVLSSAERAELARQFRFSPSALPEVPGPPTRTIRQVSPALQHLAAWISSVGAGVALNDLDGDGLPNDVCYVETRSDQVVVAPVPGSGARYAPFVLDAAPLPYDPATTAPMGCLPGDVNEDGWSDIVVYYWGRTPIGFLRRTGPAAPAAALAPASFAPHDLVPTGERWFTNAATMADMDGDGHADLLIGNYFPDGARVLDARAVRAETMQDSMSRAYNGGRKHFLLWAGATSGAAPTVRFQDAPSGLDAQVLQGWTLALGAADLDGDLLPELYIANDFGPDRLLHNASRPGRLRFTLLEGQKTLGSPNSKVVGHDSFKGMGVDFGDLNGDGQLDIFVSNITTEFALQESNFAFLSTGERLQPGAATAPYADRSEQLGLSRSGWAWDARLNDFNNDGVPEVFQATGFVRGQVNRWPELHELAMGNDSLVHRPTSWMRVLPGDDLAGQQPNSFFVRASDGRYYDLAADLGLDAPYVSRGIATADVDADGRLDVAVANQWEESLFYHNQSQQRRAFLGLRLLLPAEQAAPAATRAWPGLQRSDARGYPATGARATVSLPSGQRLVAQVDGGNGHSGKRSPELHFGLGDLPPDQPLRVDLAWRDAAGRTHQQQVALASGWHTVMLGAAP